MNSKHRGARGAVNEYVKGRGGETGKQESFEFFVFVFAHSCHMHIFFSALPVPGSIPPVSGVLSSLSLPVF